MRSAYPLLGQLPLLLPLLLEEPDPPCYCLCYCYNLLLADYQASLCYGYNLLLADYRASQGYVPYGQAEGEG